MISRLQLDLERDTLSRKYKAADKQGSIDIFRGVSFDEWLRMIIQVTALDIRSLGYALMRYHSTVLC